MKRIGVIGIVVKGDRKVSIDMQFLLNEFSDIIVGRMGVPRGDISAISLIVEGSVERISALTGKLGKFSGLSVKSALTSFEV
ncbi:MAG: CopG family transcriptional regulator [Clostridiales bacterium]|nr:CopG family transcriptional regulator [Clostridiales bacterium]